MRGWASWTGRLAALALLVAMAVVAAGCGGSDSGGTGAAAGETGKSELPGGAPLAKVGAGEGQVDLIAWAGYVEDGSTDPSADWVTPVEQKSGCRVNVKVGSTSDEMVTLMRPGQYAGVSASGDATLRLIYGGDVAPVNTDLIP